uniref:Putative secreted protein n=1 Tax=Anopheles darlingi TaxID=43151 RepID=A0A2M4DIU5_ANODA
MIIIMLIGFLCVASFISLQAIAWWLPKFVYLTSTSGNEPKPLCFNSQNTVGDWRELNMSSSLTRLELRYLHKFNGSVLCRKQLFGNLPGQIQPR